MRISRGSTWGMIRVGVLASAFALGACASSEDQAQAYYQKGQEYLSKHDVVRASIEFRNAVKLKKDMVGAWRGLAEIEESNKNWSAAVQMLRTVVQLDSQDVQAKIKLARYLLLGNAVDEADKLAGAAVEAQPDNAAALSLKATILFRLGDRAGAVREAEAALKIEPTNTDALMVLAAERTSAGDTSGALAMLDRSANGKDLGVQLFRVKLFEQKRDYQNLEAVLRQLVDSYPMEPVHRRQLVLFLIDQKRPDDAEKVLRDAAAADPSNVEAGMDVVRFLQSSKGPAAAEKELLARTAVDKISGPYQMALAETYYAQGKASEGDAALTKLVRDGSRDQALAAQARLAQAQLDRKNLDAAEALVSEILKADSRNIEGLRLRAIASIERGNYEAAINDLRQALNDQPRSSALMLLLALAYERTGTIDLAEKQFADATRVSNYDPSVGLNYVSFLRRRGSSERALEVVTELSGRSPANIPVLSVMAEMQLAKRDWTAVQEISERINRLGTNKALADQLRVAALSGMNKYDEVSRILEQARAANPDTIQPVYALVSNYVRAGDFEKAVSLLNELLARNPANAEALVMLGSVRMVQNRPDEALRSFKSATEAQPNNIAAWRALADFHARQKNFQDAERAVRAGLEVQPGNTSLKLQLAGLLEATGGDDAAIGLYEAILEQQPESLVVVNNLAALLAESRSDKASRDRAYALSSQLKRSEIPQFKDTLGWILYLRGDYKGAVPLLEQAASGMPDSGVVRYHLGMAYVAAQQAQLASDSLKKSLELAAGGEKWTDKAKEALKKLEDSAG